MRRENQWKTKYNVTEYTWGARVGMWPKLQSFCMWSLYVDLFKISSIRRKAMPDFVYNQSSIMPHFLIYWYRSKTCTIGYMSTESLIFAGTQILADIWSSGTRVENSYPSQQPGWLHLFLFYIYAPTWFIVYPFDMTGHRNRKKPSYWEDSWIYCKWNLYLLKILRLRRGQPENYCYISEEWYRV